MRAMALLGKTRAQWLLVSMSFLTRWLSAVHSSRSRTRTLLYTILYSTPNCQAPMWDHYGRKDWISACGHGCPKQISPGPFPGGNVARIDRGWAGRGLIGLLNIEAVGKETWAAKKESKDTRKCKGPMARTSCSRASFLHRQKFLLHTYCTSIQGPLRAKFAPGNGPREICFRQPCAHSLMQSLRP